MMGCKLCKRNGSHYRTSTQSPPSREDLQGSNGNVIIKALYDFNGMNDGDLCFKKGSRLEIRSADEHLLDSDTWLTATHLKTAEKGFIPSNYVCLDDGKIEHQEWWFDISRIEAERMMLRPGMRSGTYLVRNTSDGLTYVLSVLFVDTNREPSIKHYKIRRMDDGGYYISPSHACRTISDLIDSYKGEPLGLCCALTNPCPNSGPASVQFRDLEVPESAIVLGQKIGSGFFGDVYRGKLRYRIDVAVKKLKNATHMTTEQFLREAKVMHDLHHKRLISVIAVCSEKDQLMIVTEYMPKGSLLSYLHSEVGRQTRFPVLIAMASQIAEGMAYLEEKKFIHRDLRADNVLVGEYCDVKVADFGLARVLDDEDIYLAPENAKFPIHWTAPEAANFKKFSTKSDVWSFGCLLYEIITYGRKLYIGVPKHELFHKLERGYRMPKPVDVECSNVYYDIMLKCWNEKPQERPTFEYLYHFFIDYQTENEYNKNFDAVLTMYSDLTRPDPKL